METLPGALEMFRSARREVAQAMVKAGRDWQPQRYAKLEKEFQRLTRQIQSIQESIIRAA
jgi:hypothetical protein